MQPRRSFTAKSRRPQTRTEITVAVLVKAIEDNHEDRRVRESGSRGTGYGRQAQQETIKFYQAW